MLKNGDKIKLVNKMGMFDNIGEVCEVVNVGEDGTIAFKFGEGMHLGVMSADEFEKYFVKYEAPAVTKRNTITEDDIDDILCKSEIIADTLFDKCTIVSVKLPNGFVITESSACVSPENYDKELGIDICMNRIIDKIWELEGYRLQCELHNTYFEHVEECEDYEEECDGDCGNCCFGGDYIY